MNIGEKIDGWVPKIGSVVGGIGGTLSGLISMKMLAGMFVGVLAFMGIMLFTTTRERDAAVNTNRDIGNAVATAAGVDPTKFQIGQIIPTLLVIATDRDTARRERDTFKTAAGRQTIVIRRLGNESTVARARADAAVVTAFKVSRQRDVWIGKAQAAAKRTKRLDTETELKQTEDTFNALYNAGF